MSNPSAPDSPISIQPDTLALKKKAEQEGLETVWERHAAQEPRCGFCDLGLSCRICVMGPCRIDPFGEGPQRGVCGADADIMVARNLARMVAAGSAAHSSGPRPSLSIPPTPHRDRRPQKATGVRPVEHGPMVIAGGGLFGTG